LKVIYKIAEKIWKKEGIVKVLIKKIFRLKAED